MSLQFLYQNCSNDLQYYPSNQGYYQVNSQMHHHNYQQPQQIHHESQQLRSLYDENQNYAISDNYYHHMEVGHNQNQSIKRKLNDKPNNLTHKVSKRKERKDQQHQQLDGEDAEPEIKKPRKRGRPSFWSNLEYLEQQQRKEQQENISSDPSQLNTTSSTTTILTPQILIKRQRRLKANDRERNRMKNLNKTLQILKSLLPFDFTVGNNSSGSSDKGDDKLTKIETLRMATQYIYELTKLLEISSKSETENDKILSNDRGSNKINLNVSTESNLTSKTLSPSSSSLTLSSLSSLPSSSASSSSSSSPQLQLLSTNHTDNNEVSLTNIKTKRPANTSFSPPISSTLYTFSTSNSSYSASPRITNATPLIESNNQLLVSIASPSTKSATITTTTTTTTANSSSSSTSPYQTTYHCTNNNYNTEFNDNIKRASNDNLKSCYYQNNFNYAYSNINNSNSTNNIYYSNYNNLNYS